MRVLLRVLAPLRASAGVRQLFVQALELVFHCRSCHEHLTLTEFALSRIPHGAPVMAPRGIDEVLSEVSAED